MKNELTHYGVMGMKWGKRKTVVSTNAKKDRDVTKKKVEQAVKIGASVAVGLLSSSFGAGGVYALTGSQTAATIIAPSLGVLGGLKYYEWLDS